MHAPEKPTRKYLTPEKLKRKLLTPSRMWTETDGRTDRVTLVPFPPFFEKEKKGGHKSCIPCKRNGGFLKIPKAQSAPWDYYYKCDWII